MQRKDYFRCDTWLFKNAAKQVLIMTLEVLNWNSTVNNWNIRLKMALS